MKFDISLKKITFTFIHLADFFYPKRFTIEEYNKRYIIKRPTVTGSACHTTFQALFRANLARQGEVKESEQRVLYFFMNKEQKSSEDGRDEFPGVT